MTAALDEALAKLAAQPRVILAADFDGTLAPFVTDPMDAVAAPGALEALREAASLDGVSVAVVSGRDLATLHVLTGIGADASIVLIGSHGAQSSLASDLSAELLDADQQALLRELTDQLTAIAGSDGPRVECKPAGVALHTRGVPEPVAGAALAAAREVGAGRDGVHVTPGKDVVELSVVEASKGAALVALAASLRADAIVYFGDDVTDERAFVALDARGGDVTVKVGEGETAAGFRVAGIPDVVRALEYFVTARRGHWTVLSARRGNAAGRRRQP